LAEPAMPTAAACFKNCRLLPENIFVASCGAGSRFNAPAHIAIICSKRFLNSLSISPQPASGQMSGIDWVRDIGVMIR
jgi:hypothetical protein